MASIVMGGMGNFLDPPSYPTHKYHVSGVYRHMSLDMATKCENLDQQVRNAVQSMLRCWKPMPIDHPKVVDWIQQVLGYFRNCYSPDGIDRNASHCIINKLWGKEEENRHLGVMYIRQFYPEYTPCDSDWLCAYWGNKDN